MDISFDALAKAREIVRARQLDTTADTGFRKPSAINIAMPSIVEA
jgi:hypothetical protein